MNTRLSHKLTVFKLGLALACAAPAAWPLSTDKDQDIEIESDTAYLDDTKNISIYDGNVIVVQGSMRITGDKMTVHYTDDNSLEKIIVEGQPATFRQLPDDSAVYDEAEALVMEYHENRNLIVLDDQARVNQGDQRLIADHIEYDTELSQVRANSNRASGGESSDQDSRVKLIIPGRKPEPAPEN